MHEDEITRLLSKVRVGSLSVREAMEQLRHMPGELLDTAHLDHHRQLRTGLPEAVFGESKSVEQLVEILGVLLRRKNPVLATRISPDKAAAALGRLDGLTYHDTGRVLTGNREHVHQCPDAGKILIVTAGTSDLPVAEEALISLEMFGRKVRLVNDVGVAGLHRIISQGRTLREAAVIIVVAGMEGALPSVVAGMVAAPVIGVPTSVGYGTGAGGFSALLGMLNSCAPGLAVVNIDNGFGAACMAAAITNPAAG